jgi:membrane-associated two-gene conflict system component 1 (EACC1)
MQLHVRVEDSDADMTMKLRRWLIDDPEVRLFGQLTSPAALPDGTMGPDTDVIWVIVGSGLSTLQLLVSIAQWRASRHTTPTVIVYQQPPGQVSVRIDTDDSAQLEDKARALEAG